MNERINDKIKEIEKYLKELEEFKPSNFEDYEKDVLRKSACERHFEKIIEAVIDLSFIFINENKTETPEDDEGVLDVLVSKEVISKELARKLKSSKGMRNFIVHLYGSINDELVFNSIDEELCKDVREFLESVKRRL